MLQLVHRVIARHPLGPAGLKGDDAGSGAVTLVQPSGCAAKLDIQLRCLALDGMYGGGTEGTSAFVERPAPSDAARQAAACTHRMAFG